jgi:hypothetical protein
MNFDIVINDEIETLGLITYEIKQEGKELIRSGILKTHLYIEEIHSLSCDRFRLDGIEVYAETSGSNDIFYVYVFEYESVEILNNGTDYKLEELLEMYKKEVE